MQTSYCLDWLQYSVAWPNGVFSWPKDYETGSAVARSALPHSIDIKALPGDDFYPVRGYNTVYPFNVARVNVHSERRAQKMGVIMAGSELSEAAKLGITDRKCLEYACKVADKVTRLDFALDLKGEQIDVYEAYESWEHGELSTKAHSVCPYRSSSKTSAGDVQSATTVYFGSRESDRFVRIYDKASQTGTGKPWVRLEIVLRDIRADYAAREMSRSGIKGVGMFLLQDFLSGGPSWLETALTGEAIAVQDVGRKETNTEKWLRNQVLPVLVRVCQENKAKNDWSLYDEYQSALDKLIIGRYVK